MKKDDLIAKQAEIRDEQRRRIDEIHAILHEVQRDGYRAGLSEKSWPYELHQYLSKLHKLAHDFMWGMDYAILIHERIAILEGRDPKDVSRALWPVRTYPESTKSYWEDKKDE